MMPEFELELDRVATGGAGLGTGPDGRVVFAVGGLPGERVRVEVIKEHRRRIEGAVVDVVTPAPGRCLVACRHVDDGCGGCDWQHVELDTQRELRRAIVVDCLRRLAKIDEPDVRLGPPLTGIDYRTTVRAAVSEGRAGYRAGRSHRVVTVDECGVAHPVVEEVLVEGRFGSASEVTVRAGARTGERLVLVAPTAEGVMVPDDVIVVGYDEIKAGRLAAYHERIRSRSLRISASSFFQCRPDGAEALVDLVETALGDADGPLLDAYGGVGLFGVCLAGTRSVIGVESNRWSAADAEINYGVAGGGGERSFVVERTKVERWRAQPVGAIVADPARTGLGKAAAERLAVTQAPVIALVSCDPASLARDSSLLAGHGYDLDWVTTLDLFAKTSHVETVSRFVRR
ncbi:MAG: class I SAM-dependent RNA methyltransferase [Actinomycetia bacterium]|nr:class I SAM-dependent RNA methyltransferase [Actinomycetes bacterium]MCP4227430.1 class I SAM-dependent RNA methyltransferase [Actinomycetes bacterium]MCP5033674.1 class I SAM-dependent RNA methyltransferase [Actinomycetes bacterium]